MQITVHNSGASEMLKIADKIMAKYPLDSEMGTIPIEIRGQSAISSLAHIKNSKHFSVCDVERLAEANNIVIPREQQKFMDSLHCVHWNEMTGDTRDYLMAMLVTIFKEPISKSNV